MADAGIDRSKFRVLCYNILAEFHAWTDVGRSFNYPYCPEKFLESGYRRKLVLSQLAEYNADILCLQEVDENAYRSLFLPELSKHGYSGTFVRKSDIPEGCATFYRSCSLTLIVSEQIVLSDALRSERNSDLYNKIKCNEKLLETVISRGTSLSMMLLETTANELLVVINVHLFWDDRGGHIRAIQSQLVVREMEHFIQRCMISDTNLANKLLARIVAGDYNSDPYSAAVQLMTDGKVPSNHSDWFAMGEEEYQPGIELLGKIKYQSACGYPAYTSFVPEFRKCIDYIFIDPKVLQVIEIHPLSQSYEETTRYTALPNEFAPSDHIPLVVDLKFNLQCK
uniref:2',5'-phosphodiesterase 12-like n=1 Tax=Styela clava TaxID=7725 RepID=UPI00193A6292|nr:2',5'-phosphodiesterase 12-like [Styela clava]